LTLDWGLNSSLEMQAIERLSENWLYPEIIPYRSEKLKVSEKHDLYFEECGNPNGKPVVFLHGGPGAGCSASHRRFFDPRRYRIILFDQRGCGRSTPHASLDENTTWDLVEDIEKIRKHLGVEQWQVFGGSWGSTLALAYAETHPSRVTELVLRGIFSLRQRELKWFYQDGASYLFPDAWENYLAVIPEAERGDLVMAYHKRLTSEDSAMRLRAAKAWAKWELSTSGLIVGEESIREAERDEFALAFSRIECHYFVNRGFFEQDDFLISNIQKIKHIPTVIVQGRYDVVCPMDTAWALHRAWPEADFVIVPDAGHSAFEVGISRALIAATDKFSDLTS